MANAASNTPSAGNTKNGNTLKYLSNTINCSEVRTTTNILHILELSRRYLVCPYATCCSKTEYQVSS